MEIRLKRFLSLAMAIIMVIGMMPTNVVRAEEPAAAEATEPAATVAPTEEAPAESAETEPAATEAPAETEAPVIIENPENATFRPRL